MTGPRPPSGALPGGPQTQTCLTRHPGCPVAPLNTGRRRQGPEGQPPSHPTSPQRVRPDQQTRQAPQQVSLISLAGGGNAKTLCSALPSASRSQSLRGAARGPARPPLPSGSGSPRPPPRVCGRSPLPGAWPLHSLPPPRVSVPQVLPPTTSSLGPLRSLYEAQAPAAQAPELPASPPGSPYPAPGKPRARRAPSARGPAVKSRWEFGGP